MVYAKAGRGSPGSESALERGLQEQAASESAQASSRTTAHLRWGCSSLRSVLLTIYSPLEPP